MIAEAHARDVKVLVSIGGGGVPDNSVLKARYFDLIAAAKRAGFVAKVSGYLGDHGFDGLDVDLEGPAINGDYGAFIRELASALKPGGKLLTAALSRGYGGENVPDSALEQLDFLNVMAYDGAGPWDPGEAGAALLIGLRQGRRRVLGRARRPRLEDRARRPVLRLWFRQGAPQGPLLLFGDRRRRIPAPGIRIRWGRRSGITASRRSRPRRDTRPIAVWGV